MYVCMYVYMYICIYTSGNIRRHLLYNYNYTAILTTDNYTAKLACET